MIAIVALLAEHPLVKRRAQACALARRQASVMLYNTGRSQSGRKLLSRLGWTSTDVNGRSRRFTHEPLRVASSAAPKCSNQTDLHLTFTDPI
jgi:hypothetical protein